MTSPLSNADRLGALPSRAELTALADQTLAEYIRYLTAYGGQLHERDGLLLFAGAHRQPNPYRNGVLRIDDTLAPEDRFSRAERFFTMQRRSYAIWTREHGDAELEQASASAPHANDMQRSQRRPSKLLMLSIVTPSMIKACPCRQRHEPARSPC